MQTKKLGMTSLCPSVVGFGTWGLGGGAYGPMDESDAMELLRLAFDRGVNFYDTSDLYGDGKSEERLGKFFSGKRDKVYFATKGGTLPHSGFVMPQDFSKKHLTRALEGSLKRLKTDYIDLYQLHSPTLQNIEEEDCVNTLEGFKKSGQIKEYGVSVRSPMDGVVAIEEFGFKSVQVNFNIIDQRAESCGLFDAAIKKGAGLICRTPLCFGFLSGKMGPSEKFEGGDHRGNWPKDQLKIWADAPSLFSTLIKEKGLNYVQLALLFCLAQEAVSTVIPGMMNIAELEEDLGVIDLSPLSNLDLSQIREIYQSNTFYDNTAKSRGVQ